MLTVSATAGNLASGTYTGTITITASGAVNSPVVVPVVFRIGPTITGPYTISTIAGVNTIVEGGAASAQPMSPPQSVALDSAGNVYMAVPDRHKVYKMTPGGILTTFAGTGQPGPAGDGGPATSAQLNSPRGVAVDGNGDVYIADASNGRIRKVSSSSGIITTIVGGPTTAFPSFFPQGVAVDSPGNVYVADTYHNMIRKIAFNGAVTTVAGNGANGFSGDGGAATSAKLSYPQSVAVDAGGNLYIVDGNNNRIRKVSASDGTISTFAGTGGCCSSGDGGPATSAQLSYPQAVATDGSGNVYIADAQRIRKVDAGGTITTVAGTYYGFAGDGGAATSAQLRNPTGIAVSASGDLYIADGGNNRIRKVTASDGHIQTIVGGGSPGFAGDNGAATSAQFAFPQGVAVDLASNVYIADQSNHRIRKVAPDGTVSTVAGTGTAGFSGDGGPATSAFLSYPNAVAVDASGNLFISDASNYRIRKVTPGGTITTVAGNGVCCGFNGDGGPATAAQLNYSNGLAIDASGVLYIADTYNQRVRTVGVDGIINTIAGTGTAGSSGDGGPATLAQVGYPVTVALDSVGNLYVGSYYGARKVSRDGTISTIQGGPYVAVDAADRVVSSYSCGSINATTTDGYSQSVAGFNCGFYGDGGPALAAALNVAGLAIDAGGQIFFADPSNHLVRKLTPIAAGTATLTSYTSGLNFFVSRVTTSSQSSIYASLDGTGNFTWTASTSVTTPSGGNWLSIGTSSGAGSIGSIPVSVNAAGLAAGIYNGVVTISSPQAVNGSISIPVTMNVSESDNPVPTLTSITPTSVAVGAGDTTITLTGTNFIPSSLAQAGYGGYATDLATTFVSSTQLTAVVPAYYLSSNTSLTIDVSNPAPGGGISVGRVLVVGTGSTPTITAIAPNSGMQGSVVSTIISGTNLSGATQINFSGSGVTATIGSGATATSLPITVTIAPEAATGNRTVTVTTPGGTSNPFSAFTVNTPTGLTPTINALAANPSGLSQVVAPWYGGPFILTVNGTNFDAGAVVSLGSTNLTTTRVSGTQVTAQVLGSALATIGNQGVKVTNPSGLFSNIVQLWDIERGDLNWDRKVNIGDALVCALTVGGINKPALPNSVGDMNLNGSTNIGDCLVLALFAGRVNANFTVPVITSVSPSLAVRGSPLTITGTGFAANAADNQVLFSSVDNGVTRVSVSAATTTSLSVTVPNDAVSGPMQAFRLDTPLGGAEFGVTVSGTSTPLALTAVNPYFQVGEGESVTLAGMGFNATPANNSVLFKSAAGTVSGTVTAATTTSLTVTVPAGAVCGPVTAGVGGQTSNARTVTIAGTTCALQLADIWGGGFAGDVVVLEGAGFDVATPANNVVKFTASGGATVTAPVLAAGGTQLHVRIPDTAAQGSVTVTVGATTSNPITYVPPPAMVSLSIDVVVNSANAVGSFQVTIGYNKNIVQLDVANVSGGTGAGFTGAPVTTNIDNATGTVTINTFQTGNSPTGAFTVAHLVFTPIAVGTSNLTLSGVTLTDTAGNDLPPYRIVLSSNSITVVSVP
jgi:sugar lactone lactonase YvrE